jgi:hypothetical protein
MPPVVGVTVPPTAEDEPPADAPFIKPPCMPGDEMWELRRAYRPFTPVVAIVAVGPSIFILCCPKPVRLARGEEEEKKVDYGQKLCKKGKYKLRIQSTKTWGRKKVNPTFFLPLNISTRHNNRIGKHCKHCLTTQ